MDDQSWTMTRETRRQLVLQALRHGGNIITEGIGNYSSLMDEELAQLTRQLFESLHNVESNLRKPGWSCYEQPTEKVEVDK